MSLRTYQVKLNGRTIGIKAEKAKAEKVAREFTKVLEINQHFKELYGVVGQKENESIMWSPFGGNYPITDEPGYKASLASLMGKLPETLSEENWWTYITEAREIFQKHIPVVDKRRTEADEIVRKAEVEVVEAERKAEKEEWRTQFCQGKIIPIPEGSMAVYLEMTFDDSDSQTDYFDCHRQIGDDMLLAIVPKGAEREATARRVLANYPELSKLTWEWNTENYSMGHGNYLISEWTDHKEKIKGYDGRDEVNTRYEIRFNSYQREMLPYRDYPGAAIQAEPVTADGVTVRRNEQYHGIEVLFRAKPRQEIIDALKGLGFRWSYHNSLWYAKYSEALLEQVKTALNVT